MADAHYDAGYGGNSSNSDGIQTGVMAASLHWFGALSSVALVAGLLYWGYELTVRDVANVPVIRALDGPARVQPEDPGGQLASHQGLAVNNVQSAGEAEGPAPRIVLAPSPVELSEDDIVVGAAPASDEAAPVQSTQAAPAEDEVLQQARARAEALAEELAQGVEALDPLAPVEDAPEVEVISQAIPGVKQSPRPGIRPQAARAQTTSVSFDQSAAVSAAVAAALNLGSVEVDPASLAPGTRLVQLGAFDDRETAEAAWDKISAQFSDYMGDKQRVIQQTESGGRTFFRLRAAGFDGLSSSRRFCAVLVAKNAVCIPILAR